MEEENRKLKSQLAELQKILLQTQKKLSEQRKPTNDDRQTLLQIDNERKLRLEAEAKFKELTSQLEETELELQKTKKQLEDENVSVELGYYLLALPF
jgi:phage repressor protein C with HTH and peptisase S24 domain